MSDEDVDKAISIIERLKPDGVLVGERGLLSELRKKGTPVDIHLDHSFNIFNDIDLGCYKGIPIISPELSFNELSKFRSKRFIVMIHGPLVLMTTKEPLKAKTLTDESDRKFRTRNYGDMVQILNCSDLGLFNKAQDYLDIGVNMFYLDLAHDVGKTISIYRRILSRQAFNDKNKRHGYTTGHLTRGVD
jgi:collagenase-like PrtC family protease